jgi:hypothetical protein
MREERGERSKEGRGRRMEERAEERREDGGAYPEEGGRRRRGEKGAASKGKAQQGAHIVSSAPTVPCGVCRARGIFCTGIGSRGG